MKPLYLVLGINMGYPEDNGDAVPIYTNVACITTSKVEAETTAARECKKKWCINARVYTIGADLLETFREDEG